jgi:aspartyl protease family protein
MLKIAVFFAALAAALAIFAPDFVMSLSPQTASPAAQRASASPQETRAAATSGDRELALAADAGGQYSVEALVGGQSVHMLVDTGATMVVISASLADRLGLSPESGRKWRVRTANGDAVATEAILPSVDLGTVYQANVPALIADRTAGEVNLLGMSFLRRLSSVEQRNGQLVLRQ